MQSRYVTDSTDEIMEQVLMGGKKKQSSTNNNGPKTEEDFVELAVAAKIDSSAYKVESCDNDNEKSYLQNWKAPY